MVTGVIRNKIDKIWTDIWAGGITNPLTVIEKPGSHNLILLHDGGCDSAMLSWSEVLNCFDDRFTVFAPDLPGYGGSDAYNDIVGENFYNIHVKCLKEMMEKLKLCHFGLAGLFYGRRDIHGVRLKIS